MMQQQAALMAATQGSYLNPMAAIAAAQMQQMAAFNVNGLVATPMTPSSGGNQRRLTPHLHHVCLTECVVNLFFQAGQEVTERNTRDSFIFQKKSNLLK